MPSAAIGARSSSIPQLSGAHYGLAFLLLKRGDASGAEDISRRFSRAAERATEAERWVTHARQTLEQLRSGTESRTSLAEPE